LQCKAYSSRTFNNPAAGALANIVRYLLNATDDVGNLLPSMLPSYTRTLFTYVLCALAVTLSASRAEADATVTILNRPATLTPGQQVTLNVQFTKSPTEPEKRVVVLLQLHQLPSMTQVAKVVADNGGAGYTGTGGTVPCTLTVPANASGQYCFKAWVSPWSLNRAIVTHYKSYPTDGTFTYLWSGGGYGVTQNVYYLGSLIAPKPAGNTTYCSGLAFEAFVLPANAYNATYGNTRIGNIATASQMETFRKLWYGVTDSEKLAARAIPEWGAGREITDFEEAQEGDFVQLWRWSGSGHNPLFVNWVRNGSAQITGVRYWATQNSTNGIGYNTESFGDSTGMNRNRFYIGRAAKPRDQADFDWALGTASTESQPSAVNSAVGDWHQY